MTGMVALYRAGRQPAATRSAETGPGANACLLPVTTTKSQPRQSFRTERAGFLRFTGCALQPVRAEALRVIQVGLTASMALIAVITHHPFHVVAQRSQFVAQLAPLLLGDDAVRLEISLVA